ncbi:probable protein phosphatase 2C 80 [Musa acuminata AAA Group]|uniref:probable protein phosphatase 2C 80 n=1 Tax=Musa acuminata AAA Group TaxID=214697 RepID=UPI0031DF0935
MPATHISSNKLLRFSVELLFREGQTGLFQSHSFSSLVDSVQTFPIIDRYTSSQSIVGKLSQLVPFPSLAGSSCQSRIHNIGSLVSVFPQRSFIHFERDVTSTCTSLPGGATWAVRHDSRDTRGSFLRADAFFPNRSLDYWKRVCKTLRCKEVLGSYLVYKQFLSETIGKSLSCNFFAQGGIELFSLFFTSCTTGAAPVLSLDQSLREEQLDNPSSESDQKKPSNRALKLLSGSCYLPHPDKEETGGEDAHFIWDEQAIGVADGVGGWANHGVDAGQYSRALMSHSVDAIEEESKGSIDPLRVLEKAYTRTKAEGSSTACIIALTDQGIRAVNLGDSGFIVVRDGCTIFRSPVQQHDFNFTYQLESNNASDLPSAAQVFSFPVESGDVIIAGTDGLFDNLYNSEITAVVVHGIRAGLGPQVMAQKIAALARQRAQDKNRQTPFSAAAQEAGYRYYGGKLDDITVVVSYITAFGNQAPSCLCT